ncbi:DnaJ domain-containing protein [Pseudanabaena sp. FACHB-2040]|uniref:DnaJ domain-containing protein n=1 Tax=Pseudanabaena sp. FACHB-2040 TaxID=2692859 RepID=UPI0016840A2A|nr:DnaJ domain-containing protein [Pseudanabaena sp. FACHB-2040]MBD0267894.1 DnaJ domain-containing protein [Cyanobacteria bacterium Co-bin8]MBD2258126.1 DnaJ domain-containing protein [Pseudanabaena sp. FACHB-2040]
MSLADHYRVLGLRSGAAFTEVKVAYRRLARRYHPDVNPSDQRAKDKFIQVTQAYQALAELAAPEIALPPAAVSVASPEVSSAGSSQESANAQPAAQPPDLIPRVQVNPKLSQVDQLLKQQLYEQLQQFLQTQRLPRAIALVEGLSQRFPQDLEVRQWQAITYQRWGRHLMEQQEWDKAERYLQKALRTDPHNKSLWRAVSQNLQALKQARGQVPQA